MAVGEVRLISAEYAIYARPWLVFRRHTRDKEHAKAGKVVALFAEGNGGRTHRHTLYESADFLVHEGITPRVADVTRRV